LQQGGHGNCKFAMQRTLKATRSAPRLCCHALPTARAVLQTSVPNTK
jgi:hypothetical protein